MFRWIIAMTTGMGCASGATSLSLPPISQGTGDYVETLRLVSDDRLVAVQVDLSFNPDRITLSSVAKGGAASGHVLAGRELSPGMWRAVLTSPTNAVFGDGDLLAITFESSVPLTADDRVFSLANVEFSTDRAFGVSASLAPYVEITTPTEGGSTPAAQDVVITAISVATDGAIDRVEFFAGDLSIGIATAAPYSVNYFPTALGTAVVAAVAVTDLGASSRDDVEFTVSGTPYFATWRAARFTPAQLADPAISGVTANPDRDGLVNLLEYFLGLDPLVSDDATPRMRSGSVEVDGETYLTLTLRKPIAVNDASHRVAASTDLSFADPGAGSAVLHSRSFDGDDEILVYRDSVPVSGSRRSFLRAAFEISPAP